MGNGLSYAWDVLGLHLNVNCWVKKIRKFDIRVKPEEVEDTKVLIRIRKSKKDRQHDGHYKKSKRTNNDLQKTKVRAT